MARLSELGIDFDHWCFACGRANPYGLHLDFEVARGRAETRFVSTREHTGYDGFVHGGIVTALLDETMGWAIFHQGIWGVTGKLAVSFRKPIVVGDTLTVRAHVTKQTRRAVEIHGEVLDEAGAVLADADGVFIVMPEERRRELEQRYSRIDEAFAKVREAVKAEEEHSEERERRAIDSRGASPTSGVEAARRRPPEAGPGVGAPVQRAERACERVEKEHMRT